MRLVRNLVQLWKRDLHIRNNMKVTICCHYLERDELNYIEPRPRIVTPNSASEIHKNMIARFEKYLKSAVSSLKFRNSFTALHELVIDIRLLFPYGRPTLRQRIVAHSALFYFWDPRIFSKLRVVERNVFF